MQLTILRSGPRCIGFAQSLKYALIEEEQQERFKRHRRMNLA
jgi:hypothetical protein